MSQKKTAIIIGGGPAGLTAAYELLTRTDIHPIVIEQQDHVGGISATLDYKGNKIDMGGHRFFSKSDRIMDWWLNIMPLQKMADGASQIQYHGQTRIIEGAGQTAPDPETEDRVMLVRKRKSRIYFVRKFFDYPLSLSWQTIRNLGLLRMIRIATSYAWRMLFPIKPEKNLEDFFINRFGRELYETFFKSYTEKVWGTPCNEMSAEWGAQRVKGLSIRKALQQAIVKPFRRRNADIAQKNVETSLIEQFLYPKFGPGHMWQEVAKEVVAKGGEVLLEQTITGMTMNGNHAQSVEIRDVKTGQARTVECDYVFSTMPIRQLINLLGEHVPQEARQFGADLPYRELMVVGVLVKQFSPKRKKPNEPIDDNWIYIQEPDVSVGRIQIFNNWSKYLVKDPNTIWLGMEYFCNEGDVLWNKPDEEMKQFAAAELSQLGLVESHDVLDSIVIRVPKAYPVYSGGHDHFETIRTYLDSLENVFCVGRNGMHKYNNQDHSMLAAMTVVDNILEGRTDRENIWAVNTEQEYHEKK